MEILRNRFIFGCLSLVLREIGQSTSAYHLSIRLSLDASPKLCEFASPSQLIRISVFCLRNFFIFSTHNAVIAFLPRSSSFFPENSPISDVMTR